MDRRDALKRLGAVGVTATAASLIVSSPAFADGGTVTARPTVPGPPTLAAFVFGSASASFGSAACPSVGPGPATARIDYSIYQVGGTGTLGGAVQSPGVYSIGSPTGNPTGRTSGAISFTGASVTVRIDVRYVCRESGGAPPGVPAWRCRSWERTYTDVFAGIVYSGAAWVEVTPTSCGTPT